MKHLILLSLLLISSNLRAFAQQPMPTIPRPSRENPQPFPTPSGPRQGDFFQLGTLRGTVVFKGSIVSRATVTAISKTTGESASSSTGSDGSFTISRLPPGRYKLIVCAPGFRTMTMDNVEVQLQSTLAVRVEMDDVPVWPPKDPKPAKSGSSQGGSSTLVTSYVRNVEASEESFKDDLELTQWLGTRKKEGKWYDRHIRANPPPPDDEVNAGCKAAKDVLMANLKTLTSDLESARRFAWSGWESPTELKKSLGIKSP